MALKMTANELELQTNYYKFITQKRRYNTKKPKKTEKFQKKLDLSKWIKLEKKKKKFMMDTFLLRLTQFEKIGSKR